MKINVCDAICGSGKTSAVINMMNKNKDRRYMFVTQYLTEVERIKSSCSSRHFISPTDDEGTKLSDIVNLLSSGENIATTHSLFTSYTDEVKNAIKEQGYTLVLDEVIEVANPTHISADDLRILEASKAIVEQNGSYVWVDDSYDAHDKFNMFREAASLSRSKNLVRENNTLFFWMIPPELFSCFSEVYVLTYMFFAQPLRCFFDINHMEYDYIGVRFSNGAYELCDAASMDRSRDFRNKIHILEHTKANSIGVRRTDLSYSWYSVKGKTDERCDLMRRNVQNVFKNVFKSKGSNSLWTVFKECEDRVASKGCGSSFIPFNKRASNEYADRTYLAYCVNNFPRPWEANYYHRNGSEIDSDMYALSILIQWIFRSAIRRDEEIWVYIPSARMRWLLKSWIENLYEGHDLDPLKYDATIEKGKI